MPKGWTTIWWFPLMVEKTGLWEIDWLTSKWGTVRVWRWQKDRISRLDEYNK